jgi:transcriptional regulator with XRE-family HTH domain
VSFKHLFGERLLIERTKLGITQAELAEQSGLKREMIGKYERGNAEPGIAAIHALGKRGVDIAYLVTGNPHALTKEEANLVSAFRGMDAMAKAALLGVVKGVQAQSQKANEDKEAPTKTRKPAATKRAAAAKIKRV